MDGSNAFRQLLRLPACRSATLTRPHIHMVATTMLPSSHVRLLSLPRVMQPSFWASMAPKFTKTKSSQPRFHTWNPATPYIILSLLVGSQAIQTLWLKQEHNHELRKAEAKIGLLREMIDGVQRGQDVPVEAWVGIGDGKKESEWTEFIEKIKKEKALFQNKKQRKAIKEATAEEMEARKASNQDLHEDLAPLTSRVESFQGAKFY